MLDVTAGVRWWSVPVTGLLDEPAHLLTAWLLLTALLPDRLTAVRPWALLGAVAIDVDHIPLYLWHVGTASPSGRPVTHSLLTVALLGLAALPARRLRTALGGLSVGVVLHLVRDLATGPGAPLLWPLSTESVLAPYWLYLVVLVAAAVWATRRRHRHRSAAALPGGASTAASEAEAQPGEQRS